MAVSSVSNIYENRVKYAEYFDKSGNDMATIDTFYKLLVAEMSNQDPLEPMSNTEFVSQMANFTSLQVQQEALYFNNANYAQSLVGKTVIVAASVGQGIDVQTGTVTRMDFSGGQFNLTVNDKEYPLKNVMEVLDVGYGKAGGSDGAFATSLIGKQVTTGLVKSDGSAVVETGIVERVEIKDGEISVIIDNIAYPLYSVAKIENPALVVTNPDEEGTDNIGTDTIGTDTPGEPTETEVIPETGGEIEDDDDGETGVIPEDDDGETKDGDEADGGDIE
ncbi:MAG: flagellar hook capping protein [Oscillospiraceae bacterium]|jgi:flagellar basal-body rod modification protein FlgD|nr:flagellar hook capping protein [Oscillospiraceae bacterium]